MLILTGSSQQWEEHILTCAGQEWKAEKKLLNAELALQFEKGVAQGLQVCVSRTCLGRRLHFTCNLSIVDNAFFFCFQDALAPAPQREIQFKSCLLPDAKGSNVGFAFHGRHEYIVFWPRVRPEYRHLLPKKTYLVEKGRGFTVPKDLQNIWLSGKVESNRLRKRALPDDAAAASDTGVSVCRLMGTTQTTIRPVCGYCVFRSL